MSYLLTPDPLRGYESGRVHVCVPPINPDPFRVMSRVDVYSVLFHLVVNCDCTVPSHGCYESGRVHVCVPRINPEPFSVMSRVAVYSVLFHLGVDYDCTPSQR